jgi:hypothetical protein
MFADVQQLQALYNGYLAGASSMRSMSGHTGGYGKK